MLTRKNLNFWKETEKKNEFLFAKGRMEWCANVWSDSVGASQHGRHHRWIVGESAHVCAANVRIGSHWGCNTHRPRVHVHHRHRCHHAMRHERHRGWSRIGNEHRLRRRRSWICQLVHRWRVVPRLACQREVVNVDIQPANVAPGPSRVDSPHSLQSSHKEIT